MTLLRPLAFAAAFALAACQTTTTSTSTVTTPAQPVVVAPAGSFASLLNAQRSAQGLGSVSPDAALARAAQAHAAEMAANGYFSHTGLNGSRFTQRARAAGYGCAIAENIAQGPRTEAGVMEMWMNSSGHRRNILLSNAREFGLGQSGGYWVLMLGSGC